MNKPTQFKLILPADVKDWLEQQASKNVRSQGAEIVVRLRAAMERSPDYAPENITDNSPKNSPDDTREIARHR